MPDKYLYLAVDFGCILFPLLFSFHPKFRFVSQLRYFILPCFVTAVVFLIWDGLFTSAGIWGFNERYLTGIYLGNLPLEEVLFFVSIPYACVFTYFCVDKYLNTTGLLKPSKLLSLLLVVFLFAIGASNLLKLYTSVTFLSLGVVISLLLLLRVKFLPSFYLTFILILLPFFLSNGVLTGMFTPEPVVHYNDSFNLGIRMVSIPVEDTFYGMLLLLLNVSGFEYIRCRLEAANT